MLLIKCVTAHLVMRELMEKEMDYKSAHAVMMLFHALKPHVDFYAAEERKLIERYAQRDDDGRVKFDGNNWTMADISLTNEYLSEISSLGGIEIEGFAEPVKVSAMPDIRPRQLEALAGFIEFGAVEGGGE